MGSHHRRFDSARKRKPAPERVKRVRPTPALRPIAWTLLFLMALFFFITSFSNSLNIDLQLDDLTKIVLVLLAMGMVFISLRDKKDKIIENRRKKILKKLLVQQKKALKNHFDLQKKLAANSSLNFVVNLADTVASETKEKTAMSESPSDRTEEGGPIAERITSLSQTNLAQTVVEGEDISSFPQEWQRFFVENEGKDAVEKLNKMLENTNNEN